MNPDILRAPSLSRTLKLAAVTIVITLQVFYAVWMETDYGKALFWSYDELWDSAKRQEAAGNVREAERLIRHIVTLEENRVTMKYGLFVWFAGPDYLVRAKLKLARMDWQQGRLRDADEGYRDTLAEVVDIDSGDNWEYPVVQLQYAEFLIATGRLEDARLRLALAQDKADAIVKKTYLPWQDFEGQHQPYVAELSRKIAALRQQHGWSQPR